MNQRLDDKPVEASLVSVAEPTPVDELMCNTAMYKRKHAELSKMLTRYELSTNPTVKVALDTRLKEKTAELTSMRKYLERVLGTNFLKQ